MSMKSIRFVVGSTGIWGPSAALQGGDMDIGNRGFSGIDKHLMVVAVLAICSILPGVSAWGGEAVSASDTAASYLRHIHRSFYAPLGEAYLDSLAAENNIINPEMPSPYDDPGLYDLLMQYAGPILQVAADLPNSNPAPLVLGTLHIGLPQAYMFPVPESAQGVIVVDLDLMAFMMAITKLALSTIEVSALGVKQGTALQISSSDSVFVRQVVSDTTLISDFCNLLDHLLLGEADFPSRPLDAESSHLFVYLIEAQGRFVVAHEVAHHVLRHQPSRMQPVPGMDDRNIKSAAFSWRDEILADLLGERLLLGSLASLREKDTMLPGGERDMLMLKGCAPILSFVAYDILEEATYLVRNDQLLAPVDSTSTRMMSQAAMSLAVREFLDSGNTLDESATEYGSVAFFDSLIALVPHEIANRSHPPFALRRGYYLQTLDMMDLGTEMSIADAVLLNGDILESDAILSEARLCGRLATNLKYLWELAIPEFRERVRAMRARGDTPWVEYRNADSN